MTPAAPERAARARFPPALLLGICPLLGAADTLATGLGLGGALLLVMASASALRSAPAGRAGIGRDLSAVMLILASVMTLIGLLARAFVFEMHLALGPWLPVILASGAIIGCALERSETTPAIGTLLTGAAPP